MRNVKLLSFPYDTLIGIGDGGTEELRDGDAGDDDIVIVLFVQVVVRVDTGGGGGGGEATGVVVTLRSLERLSVNDGKVKSTSTLR